MNSMSTHNTYTLLAKFLTPDKTSEQINALRQMIIDGRVSWPGVVYCANVQLCTPLWYVQLQRDGLLAFLPDDLVAYLRELHQANVERNNDLQQGMAELLERFAQQQIVPVVLKGAATFCDDLYGDPGARVMGDLDILVADKDVATAQQIMLDLGYQEVYDQGMERDGLPSDERHHQLPRYLKPNTPIVIEIHFKVSYGQAGRSLPVDQAWANSIATEYRRIPVRLLNPTWRLLHNAIHALLPHCEFISGDISLLQLAEYRHLTGHYADDIDWSMLLRHSKQHQLHKEMTVYHQLASELLGAKSIEDTVRNYTKRHIKRIIEVGLQHGCPEQTKRSLAVTWYYYSRLPLWVWRNVCYMEGIHNVPLRVGFMLKKALSARSRAKI